MIPFIYLSRFSVLPFETTRLNIESSCKSFATEELHAVANPYVDACVTSAKTSKAMLEAMLGAGAVGGAGASPLSGQVLQAVWTAVCRYGLFMLAPLTTSIGGNVAPSWVSVQVHCRAAGQWTGQSQGVHCIR